ncbi:MAG: PepSY domain-containing protein, partial [Candidatus Bipolaricaulia bacterium]
LLSLAVLALLVGAAFYGLHGVALGAGGGGNGEENVQEPSYACSISAPEDASAQTLAGLAKITASDAEQAALAQFPSATVLQTELDSENGCLVYSVELQSASGVKDVKVDAGTGQVLHVEAGGDLGEEHGGGEADSD